MRLAILAAAMIMVPALALAAPNTDPGSTKITKSRTVGGPANSWDTCGGSSGMALVKPGHTCYYALNASSNNSAIFKVEKNASVCFFDRFVGNPAASVAIVWIRMALHAEVTLWEQSFTPVPPDGTNPLTNADIDCMALVTGWYWIDVESTEAAEPTGGQVPGLMITGLE